MCDCDWIDPPEFYNEKFVVGRKDYWCCECHKPIAKGERHFMASGRWQGDFEVFRRCERCQRLCEAIQKSGHCTLFGGLFECHGAYRHEFIDDCTDDWQADLERAYLSSPPPTVQAEMFEQ